MIRTSWLRSAFPCFPTRHRLEIYGLRGDCQQKGVTVKYERLACPVLEVAWPGSRTAAKGARRAG